MKMAHRLQFCFTTKIFCEKGKELEKMKATSLKVIFIRSFIGNNQKCIKDYSLEIKAKMNFIFLLLPWPYR